MVALSGTFMRAVGASDPGLHRVQYSLSGSAEVTYRNPSGGTEQRDVNLPATTMSFNARSGQFVYFSAQNKGAAGTVRVRVQVDGKTLQEATSNSPYGIATVP
jgi:hypothetical protein